MLETSELKEGVYLTFYFLPHELPDSKITAAADSIFLKKLQYRYYQKRGKMRACHGLQNARSAACVRASVS